MEWVADFWVELWQAVHVVRSVTVFSVSHQCSVCRLDAIPFAYGRSSSRMDCRSSRRRKRGSSITRNRIRALGNGNWQSRGLLTGWQHPLYFTLSCIACVLTLLVGARCRGSKGNIASLCTSFSLDPGLGFLCYLMSKRNLIFLP